MGIIVNGAKHIVTNLDQTGASVLTDLKSPLQLVKRNEVTGMLGKNSASSLDFGSKTCPVVRECRDVG